MAQDTCMVCEEDATLYLCNYKGKGETELMPFCGEHMPEFDGKDDYVELPDFGV